MNWKRRYSCLSSKLQRLCPNSYARQSSCPMWIRMLYCRNTTTHLSFENSKWQYSCLSSKLKMTTGLPLDNFDPNSPKTTIEMSFENSFLYSPKMIAILKNQFETQETPPETIFLRNFILWEFLSLLSKNDDRAVFREFLQPIAFGMSFNHILQSQSNWSLFNGTWQKRRKELDNGLSFEIGEITLQMH